MTAVRRRVEDAIIDWEPRVDVEEVSVTADATEAAKLLIELRYRVRATNNVHNLVYPFYLDEGGASEPGGADHPRRATTPGRCWTTCSPAHPATSPPGGRATEGPDAAVLNVTARFVGVLLDRLDQAPLKSKLAFLDLLGINAIAPSPARTAVAFTMHDEAADVRLPAGSRLAAPPPPGSSRQIFFETERSTGLAVAQAEAGRQPVARPRPVPRSHRPVHVGTAVRAVPQAAARQHAARDLHRARRPAGAGRQGDATGGVRRHDPG